MAVSQALSFLKRAGFFLLFATACFLRPLDARAAVAYLAPDSGTYGRPFVVSVYVSSPTAAINAVAGTVTYPANLLRATKVSKNGSVLGLWASEPSIQNGSITFEGVILNPGFTGSVGKVLDITFEPIQGGEANLGLVRAQILANDGLATNVLTGTSGGTYVLSLAATNEPQPSPSAVLAELPGLPDVRSSTHPDPTLWYPNTDPVFSWHLPEDVTDVSFSVDHLSAADPGDVSKGRVDTITLPGTGEGEWFFHLKFKNAKGWGQTVHVPFHIDVSAPTHLSVTEKEMTQDHLSFSLHAEDAFSGVDHYLISVGEAPSFTWKDDGTGIVFFPVVSGEVPPILFTAVDAAGNASVPEVWQVPVPSQTEAPVSALEAFSFTSASLYGIAAILSGVLLLLLALIFLLRRYELHVVKRKRPPHNFYKRSERAFSHSFKALRHDVHQEGRHAFSPHDEKKRLAEIDRLEAITMSEIERIKLLKNVP